MKAVGCTINFLSTVFIAGFLACHGDDNEYRLLQYLLSNYDSSARPAANSSQPMQVVFGMSLHLIIDVDERNQILTTNCWLTQIWNDSHLTWNASDFGGIRVVRIPYHRVWRPDIILYNNADAQYGSSIINTNVIVSETGQVVWLSHGIFRSSCDINVEYFPFDLQSCKMKWASWTYDGYQIDLVKQTEVGDVSNYQPNGEFDLVGFEAIRHVEFYSCCPEPYPDITFVIKMRRRPMFYVFNLILPCILINGIALLVFYVPSESGEKVTLGISALLSMTVFLMTIRESLPPTEKTPLISLYYGVSICLVSFASGLSVVTLNLHHRGLRGTEVPYLLKRIILGGLARLVFLRFDSPKSETAASTNSNNSESCGCSKNKTSDSAINKPDRNIQKNNWSVTSSSNGGIFSFGAKNQAKATERLRIKLQELDRQHSGVFLDSDHAEKFHYNPDIEYSGIRPLSPKFQTRAQKTAETTLKATCEPGGVDNYEQRLSLLLSTITMAIDRNESRVEDQDRREAMQLEWKQVALVCDRILLIIFLVLTIVATCVVLMSSPHGP